MSRELKKHNAMRRLGHLFLLKGVAHLVLALAVLMAYANTLPHPFVYDDHAQIVENPNIQSLSRLGYHFQTSHKIGGFEDVENYAYRPLFWTGLALDYLLWGLNPFGYHLTNVALHFLNAAQVLVVMMATFENRILSLIVALLWALHPVHTEAVNLPSAKTVLLYALFYLLSLILFLKGTDAKDRRQFPWIVGALMAFVLSLLSYEMAVTLPAVALLLDTARAKRQGRPIGTTIRRHAPIHLLFLLSLAAYLLIRHVMLPGTGPPATGTVQGLWPRLLRVPVIVMADLSLLAFPRSLSIHRSVSIPRPQSFFDPVILGSMLFIVLLGLALARLAKDCDAPLWGMGWFLLIESSVLNIIPIYRVGAERFLYLPSAGFLAAVVFGLGRAVERLEVSRPRVKWRGYAACFCLVTVILYGLRVIVRNRDWRDDMSLLQATVAASPTSLLALRNLGDAYIKTGQLPLAEQTFLRAVNLEPASPWTYYGLGLVYQRQGRLDRALAEWQRALQIIPRYVKARLALGTVYLQQGKLAQGISELEEAARTAPEIAETHHNLGVGYLLIKRPDQAVNALGKAVALDPTNAMFHHVLGLAYRQAGKPDLATTAFAKARSLDPASAGTPLHPSLR